MSMAHTADAVQLVRQSTTHHNAAAPPAARFRVIFAFSAVAFLQGVTFSTFALVPDLSIDLLPTLTTDIEGWTLNCNNIAQMIFIPFAIYLLRKRLLPSTTTGLRTIAIIGGASQLAQSLCWYCAVMIPPTSSLVNVLVLVGSCAGGVCTGCVQGACSRLSCVWFPPAERGSATGNVYASLFLGQACATAASIFFCAENDIRRLLLGQLFASLLLGGAIVAYFPDRPQQSSLGLARAPEMAGEEPLLVVEDGPLEHRGSAESNDAVMAGRALCTMAHPGRASLLILLAISWSTGAYQAYQQVLPLAFADEGSATTLPCNSSAYERLRRRDGDLFALASSVTYALGGPVAGVLADRYFVRNLKRLMLLCFLCLGVNFGFILFTMPPPPILNSDTGGVRFGPGGEWLSLFAVGMSGLFAGMAAVPALELLAEAQTLSEGASANLVMLGIQVFAITMTYLTNVFATPGLGIVMTASIFCCVVVLIFVEEVYGRLDRMDPDDEERKLRNSEAADR